MPLSFILLPFFLPCFPLTLKHYLCLSSFLSPHLIPITLSFLVFLFCIFFSHHSHLVNYFLSTFLLCAQFLVLTLSSSILDTISFTICCLLFHLLAGLSPAFTFLPVLFLYFHLPFPNTSLSSTFNRLLSHWPFSLRFSPLSSFPSSMSTEHHNQEPPFSHLIIHIFFFLFSFHYASFSSVEQEFFYTPSCN